MELTLLIILLATDSSSQQSSKYQLYTRAAVSRYLLRAFVYKTSSPKHFSLDIPIFCISKIMALFGENERFVKVWNAHPQQQSLLQQTKF